MGKGFSKKGIFDEYIKLYNEYSQRYGKIALLYHVGAFYDMYGIENEVGNVEQICNDIGITLTRAKKSLDPPSAKNPNMAGIPCISLDETIKKLIAKEYTVITYIQHKTNDKIERRPDKVITSATYTNIAEDDYAIMACCFIEGKVISGSLIDSASGICKCFIIDSEKKLENIFKLAVPKEILVVGGELETLDKKIHRIKLNNIFLRQSYQNEFLAKIYFNGKLEGLPPIEKLGLERYTSITISLIVLLDHIYKIDDKILKHISKPKLINELNGLYLSEKTMEQLEVHNLCKILNKASTAGGRRYLQKRLFNPTTHVNALNRRYDEVESIPESISPILKNIVDLERYHRKMFTQKLQPFEFYSLTVSYESISKLLKLNIFPTIMKDRNTNRFNNFINYYKNLLKVEPMKQYNSDNMEDDIFNDKEIKKVYGELQLVYKELDAYSLKISNMIPKTKGADQDLMLKTKYTDTDGYHFEITKKRYNDYIRGKEKFNVKTQSSSLKLTNEKLQTITEKKLSLSTKLKELNKEAYLVFLEEATKYKSSLRSIANYVSYIDATLTIKLISKKYQYCRPVIVSKRPYSKRLDSSFISAKALRHPILERTSHSEFISNDCDIGESGDIVYGVNGSGKSIWVKTIGLAIILAQAGFFVPATNFEFYPYKSLVTKMPTADDFHKNRSTFTCEMLALKEMLELCGANALLLADELCSGTETNSAIAIVSATIMRLSESKSSFLFTTHLHQLKDVEDLKSLKNVSFNHLTVSFDRDRVIYGRKLQTGAGESTYGIEIARHLGVGDVDFIKNAIKIRRDIVGESLEVLKTKQSRYNKDVYMDKCEKCGCAIALHTHHIIPQSEAINGMNNGQSKNIKGNLMVLCEKCHTEIHKTFKIK